MFPLYHQSTLPNKTHSSGWAYPSSRMVLKPGKFVLPGHIFYCVHHGYFRQTFELAWQLKLGMHTHCDSGSNMGWVPPDHTTSSGSVRLKFNKKRYFVKSLYMNWVTLEHTSSCEHIIISLATQSVCLLVTVISMFKHEKTILAFLLEGNSVAV